MGNSDKARDTVQAEFDKLEAETAFLRARTNYRDALERDKISAEVAQVHQRMKWYIPVLISTGTAGLLISLHPVGF